AGALAQTITSISDAHVAVVAGAGHDLQHLPVVDLRLVAAGIEIPRASADGARERHELANALVAIVGRAHGGGPRGGWHQIETAKVGCAAAARMLDRAQH